MAGPNPTNRSVVGIAKETTRGTIVAPTAFIPVTKFSPKRIITQLRDEGWRGSNVESYGQVQGVWRTEIDIEGDVYPDTFPWLAAAILGDVVTTGAGAPFSHAMAAINSGIQQPPSYTWTDDYGIAARSYPFMMCSDLTFKFNADGKCSYTSKWVGRSESIVTAPTKSYSAVDLLAGWRCAPTIGGTAVLLLDSEIHLKRPIDAINVANNSQDPTSVWAGELGIEAKMNIIMEADTYYTSYLANTQAAVVLDFLLGAGAGTQEAKWTFSKPAIKDTEIDRGGQYIKLPLNLEPEANVTDVGASGGYSPTKFTAQNALPAGTYA